MSFKHDRLGGRKDRQIKGNISLDLASASTPKILQKEEVNEICLNNDYLCLCRG